VITCEINLVAMADPFALLNLRGHVSTLDHVRALYQQTDVARDCWRSVRLHPVPRCQRQGKMHNMCGVPYEGLTA
jgi:hypothetical protein